MRLYHDAHHEISGCGFVCVVIPFPDNSGGSARVCQSVQSNKMWEAGERIHQGIETLMAASYEAAVDGSDGCGWCAFLKELCEYFDASAGALMQSDLDCQRILVRHQFNADVWDESRGVKDLPLTIPLVTPFQTPENGSAGSGFAIRVNTASVRREFEWFRPRDDTTAHHLSAMISSEAGKSCWLRLVRPAGAAAFDIDHQIAFGQLLPHFRRSLGLRSTLVRDRTAHTTLLDIVDRFPVAMLRVDRKGFVDFRNRAADKLLAEKSGILLRRDGTIATSQPGAGDHFKRAVAKVIDGPQDHSMARARAHCLVPRGAERLPLICAFYPVPGDRSGFAGHQSPTAAVLIKDPQATVSDGIETFTCAFGLTRAEARLIGLLLEGRGLFEAADHLGVTRNTARTHMRNIYGKVGMHRQSDLIGLVERFNMF